MTTISKICECYDYHIEVVEELIFYSALNIEINKFMHKLYDFRDQIQHNRETTFKKVNRYLDKCWTVSSETKWNELKSAIEIFLT